MLDVTVGDLESGAFKSQSRAMADTWQQAKAETRYAEYPGNHFTVIDALTDPDNAMVTRIAELAQRHQDVAAARRVREQQHASGCGKDQSKADDVGTR